MEVQARKKQCITFLPEEIIELILVWLPANTLTRYRIACKQWNRIIQDPHFIMSHLQHAPHRPLLFYNRASISNKLYPSEAILFDESWSPSRWNVPVIEPNYFLCASCNGLVLLYSDKSTIKIVNLSTGECLHIAKAGKHLKGDPYNFYNFGFHPVTKEYKIIHILCKKVHVYGDKFKTIQVYTLGDDKWRDIRVPEVQSLYQMGRYGVIIVDGAMYWLNGNKESKWGLAVVSFDLSKERFEWIQLPTNVDLANSARGCFRMYYITEVDGKLCIVTGQEHYNVSRGLAGKLQIWTLDNKIDQSWSPKYSIQLSSVNIPRSYFIHGGKIVVYDYGRNIYYHELIGQNVQIQPRKMMKLLNYGPRWSRSMRSYKHVQSLVRLDAYNKGGIVCKLKQREGWESKKWVRWMQELCLLEKLWKRAYAMEHLISKLAHGIGMDINPQLEHPPEKNRLNWIEQKRVTGMLNASMGRLAFVVMDMERTMDAMQSKKIHEADQSISTPNPDISGRSTTKTDTETHQDINRVLARSTKIRVYCLALALEKKKKKLACTILCVCGIILYP